MADTQEALDIDLYQARMLIGFYLNGNANQIGTMEAFCRKLPENRKFLVVCGITRIVEYLRNLSITAADVMVFKELLPEVKFTDDLCKYLTSLDFKKLEVRAMTEGDVAFANEPFISIRGPIGMAQFVEKKILSILNHDVRIASKAARIVLAARGKPVAEFGGRRGADGMSAEIGRATYIAGFSSTSNVLCYQRYGVPCIGTMGHVWVMSHSDEGEAYANWSKHFKDSTYLPDTYNVYNGVDKIIAKCNGNIGGIRFDSGDILQNSITVRRELNNRGLTSVKLGATNDLNEYKISALLNAGAPLDWFGVGTEVVATPDAPSCSFIYKLVEVEHDGRHELVAKIAADGKGTLPGAKQVFRYTEKISGWGEVVSHDVLGLASESFPLAEISGGGKLTKVDFKATLPSAFESREHFENVLLTLPSYLRVIEPSLEYSVSLSNKLVAENSNFINKNTSKTVWGRDR